MTLRINKQQLIARMIRAVAKQTFPRNYYEEHRLRAVTDTGSTDFHLCHSIICALTEPDAGRMPTVRWDLTKPPGRRDPSASAIPVMLVKND
jgi:hypothetical protein